MQITRDFTIAAHTLLCVEFFKDSQTVTSEFIASSVGVNSVIIRKIIAKLKAAGFVETRQGASGIQLLLSPKKITLYDIYKAIGADERPVINFHERPNPQCPVGKNIHAVLDSSIDEATAALEKSLKKTTLEKLLERIGEAQKG